MTKVLKSTPKINRRDAGRGNGGYTTDNGNVAFGDHVFDPGKWNRDRKKAKENKI